MIICKKLVFNHQFFVVYNAINNIQINVLNALLFGIIIVSLKMESKHVRDKNCVDRY